MKRRNLLKRMGVLLRWLFRTKGPNFSVRRGSRKDLWYDRITVEEAASISILGTGTKLDGHWEITDTDVMRRRR